MREEVLEFSPRAAGSLDLVLVFVGTGCESVEVAAVRASFRSDSLISGDQRREETKQRPGQDDLSQESERSEKVNRHVLSSLHILASLGVLARRTHL